MIEDTSAILSSKVKGFKESKPSTFELYKSSSLSLNKVYERAESAREDVRKWAEKNYGPKFQFGWTKMDRTHPNKISVSVQVPYAVEQLLRAKLGLVSIETANATKPFLQDAENVSKDIALEHQEFISDSKFYSDFTEITPTLAKPEYVLNEDGIYDNSLEFDYDRTQETTNRITDAELFSLLNDDLNIC